MKSYFRRLVRKVWNLVKSIIVPDLTSRFWHNRERILKINNRKNILSRFYSLSNQIICARLNCAIPYSENINYFKAPHGLTGIFISLGAQIGKGCTIFQQVTIGSNTLKDSSGGGAPIIGNNVYIGAGAKIIGGVKIGNGVRIGANCVVVKDIPDNATVVLSAPRIIVHSEPRDNRFLGYEDFMAPED